MGGRVGRCANFVCEFVGERPSRIQLLVTDVRPRDLQAEIAIPVLARAEVADQRQEGTDLTAGVGEVDAADEVPATLSAQPANGLQVVTPVTSADDEAGERL